MSIKIHFHNRFTQPTNNCLISRGLPSILHDHGVGVVVRGGDLLGMEGV